MARPPPRDTRRTGDQVLIDNHSDEISELRRRVARIESLIWWVLGGASGIGFVIGVLAKPVAKIILP